MTVFLYIVLRWFPSSKNIEIDLFSLDWRVSLTGSSLPPSSPALSTGSGDETSMTIFSSRYFSFNKELGNHPASPLSPPLVMRRPTNHQALGSRLHLPPGEESSRQLHPCVLSVSTGEHETPQTSLGFLFRGELWLQEEQAEHRAEIRPIWK